jgi:1-phosphatidylinositol phosphodiesterase
MTDVFFGLYQWLNEHPTEAVLLSINHEGGRFSAKIQEMMYDIINSDAEKKYWVQTSGSVHSLLFCIDCVMLNGI